MNATVAASQKRIGGLPNVRGNTTHVLSMQAKIFAPMAIGSIENTRCFAPSYTMV